MHKKEQIFIDNFADRSKTYIYQSRWFRFKNGTKYQPDFYCIEDNTFIEVIGSKQAFNSNKAKYLLMQKEYSEIKLEFIAIGCYHTITNNKFFRNKIKNMHLKTGDLQMIAKVNETEKQSLLQLAKTKGCEGWTAFVRMLAHAKNVKIET